MSIKDKKKQINDLMPEYSLLKDDPANRGRCIAIKEKVSVLMFDTSGIVFKYLCIIARDYSKKYKTRYESDEFISETYLKYFGNYNSSINDNYMNYFIYYLKCTISNMIKKEHPEHYPPMPTYTDEEGNEIDLVDLTSSEIADPGIMAEIHSLYDLMVDYSKVSADGISEEEAENRLRFLGYFSKLIPCIIQAKEHRGNRDEYYRAFASDFYISSCKNRLHIRYKMNENDAFGNMDREFADFTLTEACRTFSAFESTPCKTYDEIGVTGREYAEGEIETPFRNGVYSVYFGVTDGAISQKRNCFHKDIGILLDEEI